MAHKNQGKNHLTEDEDGEASRVNRREFLAASSIAAVSVTGYLTGSADAAGVTDGTYGYGTESFGSYGYGGVEVTN